MKENPEIFYNLILGVLVQFYEISKIEDNFCIKQALGMITYMTIKESKWEEFVLNFPTDHFSIDEKIDIINIVKEDIEMNNKLRADTRKVMLRHPITLLGKLFFDKNKEEEPFWHKITKRGGNEIKVEGNFKVKLYEAMQRVDLRLLLNH